MDWTDTRPLTEMSFAAHVAEPERTVRTERLRAIFAACGCKTAEDVIAVGCTGLAKAGLSVEEIRFVRENMAGAGVGLTCFVGMDRYCLAHEVIGGLQEGQAQRHPEFVAQISRPLTPQEQFKVDLVERAQRVRGKTMADKLVDAGDLLSGRMLPDDLKTERAGDNAPPTLSTPPDAPALHDPEYWAKAAAHIDKLAAAVEQHRARHLAAKPTWTCDEHTQTVWQCRYCVAAEVARGGLVPEFIIMPTREGTTALLDDAESIAADEVAARLKEYAAHGDVDVAALFVKVGRWSWQFVRS
jgi:hypothetical protein